MNILALAATNHKNSINQKLLVYTISVLKQSNPQAEVELINCNDYELPFYRQDREEDDGIPQKAHELYAKIGEADAVIISFAEHNGGYTAVYKNLFDWMSRIGAKVYQDKPYMIMAASPGGRGGAGVLESVETKAPFFGMDIRAKVSVPKFQDNFDFDSNEITNPDIQQNIKQAVSALLP